MTELRQKKLFQRKEYKLYDDKIFVKIKTHTEQNEWHSSLEEIGLKKLYKKQSKTVQLICSAVCFCIVLTAFFTYIFFPNQISTDSFVGNSIVWSLVGIGLLLIPIKNELIVYGGTQDLVFFRNLPNDESVEEFVNTVITKTKKFLRSKYAKVDKDLSKEIQIGNFNWLKNIEVISEEEYESLKEELNREQLF